MADPTPADQFSLRTHELCRYYKRGPQEVRALHNVDLTIGVGELLAVVGASGSGKSTLLNLLAGLDTPTSGYIEASGGRLDAMSSRSLAEFRARRVGVIFQTFNLLPHQTAIRNVEIALYFDGTRRRQRRARAAEALERLGLGDRLDHKPLDLSGGEQQRVAIARALVKRPQILLADEPSGNLDRENANEIAGIMRELNRDGMTIVLVTHDLEMARRIAGRIVSMHYGSLAEDNNPAGTP